MNHLLPICFALLLFQACNSQTPSSYGMEDERIEANQVLGKDSLSKFLTLDYLMGKFDPENHEDFVEIELKHADRAGLYLRKDTYVAFIKMYKAAKSEGISLQIRSATRNFKNQKRIWENKWTGKTLIENGENLEKTTPDSTERALKILRFSSMPSSSRHHWGTDIDLNAFNNAYFETGKGKAIYDWLQANAAEYGFCQPYTAKDENRPDGYYEEKWHWSYLPVAQPLTKFAEENFEDEYISGFKGATAAKDIGVVKKYVLGINKDCMK